MHRHSKLVIACFLAVLGASARATYINLTPPPGYTPASSGSLGTYKTGSAEQWLARTATTTSGFNLGGKTVKVPVSFPLSNTAGKFLTGRIGAALLSGAGTVVVGSALPVAALLALPAVIDWVSQQNKVKWNPVTQKWYMEEEQNQCAPLTQQEHAECYGVPGGTVVLEIVGNSCYRYVTVPGAGIVRWCATKGKTTSFTQREAPWPEPSPFLEPLRVDDPLPNGVPMPWPVDDPVINPGPDGKPRPLFIPTGDPLANPKYDPLAPPSPTNQPYFQPGVRVVPSPTPAEPWRVDVQPVDRPVATDDPMPEPVSEPTPETPTGDKPREQEYPDLCKDHPDIVACAKMDEVDPEDVNNEDKTLTITPKAGWGNESASCPAPVVKQVAGLSLEMSWQPFCDFAGGIRPVVIAMAWLSAALMVLGIARRD